MAIRERLGGNLEDFTDELAFSYGSHVLLILRFEDNLGDQEVRQLIREEINLESQLVGSAAIAVRLAD